jgi:hypothetical protein
VPTAICHHAGVASPYVTGVFVDGPLEGQELLTALNQLGWTITMSTLTSLPDRKSAVYIYEVETLGSADEPARLRFVREQS